MPRSNTPVRSLSSSDVVCNTGGRTGVVGKCRVAAGGTVTVEMHQQPGDRSCMNEAMSGAHNGPVLMYMSKVPDSGKADGSAPWFKVLEDGWSPKDGASVGDSDHWGIKDLNRCCGRMDVKIPHTLPDGDYLLRAEAIALHAAGQVGGVQLHVSCYQLTVAGSQATVLPSGLEQAKFPGAYSQREPGILIDIHTDVKSYKVPGPPVMPGGTTKAAGSGCGEGCAKTCSVAEALGQASQTDYEPMSPVDTPVGKRGMAFHS